MTRSDGWLDGGRLRALLLGALALTACGPAVTDLVSSQPEARGLEVTPRVVSLLAGGGATFTASQGGAAVSGVEWSASAGTITSAGVYTAPDRTGSFIVYASYDGLTTAATAHVVGEGSPGALHAVASSTCANMPLRSTGRVHYFCDCQSGAQSGCVAGRDTNDGASPSTPQQTWSAIISTFNAMNAGDTVALCKGGLWNVPANGNCGGQWNNPRCAAGTASLTDPAHPNTCDVRDYEASWGGTARPVLFANATGGRSAITRIINRFGSTMSGVRVMNLEFRGNNNGPRGGVYNNSNGISFGSCAISTDTHWLICNNSFQRLQVGYIPMLNNASQSYFDLWGNRFELNDLDAIMGGPGNYSKIDANFFDNNGGFTPHPNTGNRAHTLYLGAPPAGYTGAAVVNNEFRRSGYAGTPGVSATGILQGHDRFIGLNVENNVVDAGPGASASAWTIDLRAANSGPTYYRNTTIRRNWVITGGSGIVLGQSPNSIVENNVVIQSGNSTNQMAAIEAPMDVARSGQDDVANNVTIRNNTIYMTGGATASSGVKVAYEGTGHVIANNVVYRTNGRCFDTPLAAGAYAFVGNNACFGGAVWGTTFDATPHVTSNPLFTDAPANFVPAAGSPLIGAGIAAHAPSIDFTPAARPSPPSIGAYEP